MKAKTKLLTALLLSPLFLGISGCATPDSDEIYKDMSAEEIFNKGVAKVKKSRFSDAVKDFEALEARYPFGEYAEKSQLAEIYTAFKSEDAPHSLAAAERFIRLNPRHEHVDYAYYMKGIVHFEESLGFFSKYLPMERAARDTKAAEEAFEDFSYLVNYYPYSKYVPDAKRRMVYLYNILAENELYAARFNMHRKAYLAAVGRTKYLIDNFDQSPWAEEALAIQTEAYQKLNLEEYAKLSLQALSMNFPESHYINKLSKG